MAFYDGFSKKISTSGQAAVQKTKDFAEVSRINSEITETERNMNMMYAELGKKYYELQRSEDVLPELAETVSGISRLIEHKEELRKQINLIRRVVICPACGKEVKMGDMFCSNCGAKMPEPEVRVCAKCGAVLGESSLFCTECGTKVEQPEAAAAVNENDDQAPDVQMQNGE